MMSSPTWRDIGLPKLDFLTFQTSSSKFLKRLKSLSLTLYVIKYEFTYHKYLRRDVTVTQVITYVCYYWHRAIFNEWKSLVYWGNF